MIITHVKDSPLINHTFMNNFPDPFTTEKQKVSDKEVIRSSMDFFANLAYTTYGENVHKIARNYQLMKGIIKSEDFYRDNYIPEFHGVVDDWVDTLTKNMGLPDHVKHYPILNPPVNTMLGELSKRPDIHRVRAFDSDSRSEELEYKTTMVHQLILEGARSTIMNKLALDGVDGEQLDPEELSRMISDKVSDLLTDYTSLAERWGNHMLTALKAVFNIKEKSEDAFRDLLICSRQFYEIYEDTSKIGFNVRTHNPKNIWMLGTPDPKYTSGVSGEQGTPYAIGTIYIKEISEIIDEFPWLTKEEVDHLRDIQNQFLMMNAKSNIGTTASGIETINYQTYDRGVYQMQEFAQSQINEPYEDNLSVFQANSSSFSFGYKYTVVKAYWSSKKKIGALVFIDENGDEQTTLVDETYEKSPNEVSIEWGWVNQWYEGVKIGRDIYNVRPVTILDYSPIIGLIYEAKNSPPASLVDMMKPYQMLFNICMNQLYELLEKEIGNVASVNLRRIPRTKDGDDNDALDAWMQYAKDEGVIFDDDSPENTKAPVQNTSIARNIDLTRSNEMQMRMNMAVQLQEMCWQLVGMNRQRLGASMATQTATANQNDLAQSFAQTEPYFTAHNYVLNQLYQAILDAAQYIESKKPLSTINYITPQGESSFLQVAGGDISLKDLKVLVTSKAEDQQLFNEFRQLSQAMLQNGASIYDVSTLFTTNSIRTMQKVFKDLKDKQERMMQAQQENEQAAIQSQNQVEMARLEQEERHHQDDIMIEKYKVDVQANTKILEANLKNYFQMPGTDSDGDGTPDAIEFSNHALQQQEAIRRADLENKQLNLKQMEFMAKQEQAKVDNEIAREKLKNEKEKIKIARKKPKSSK